MLEFKDINFDCAHYNGYKPCLHGNHCATCLEYEQVLLPSGQPYKGAPPQPLNIVTPVTSIVIIKTGAMGDVLRTTTLLPALARSFPDARVTWVTDKSAVPLLQGNPYIHELLEFNEVTSELLIGREFDLLLNYEKEKAPLVLAGNIHATYRVGFAPTPWVTSTVFNAEAIPGLILGLSDEFKFRINAKSYPQIICEMAGLVYQRDPYVLALSDDSHRRRSEIEALLPDATRPRVGLNTGCGAVFRTKQWTLDGWVGLVHYLQQETNAAILLLGGKAEEELNRQILERTSGVVDAGCHNSLPEFFGVVDACDAIVTSDSLGMHVAIALGKYVVALFGSTSHQEIDLYDRGEKVITDFACSPCYLKNCDKNPTCMQAMSPQQVGGAVVRGLSKIQRTPPEPRLEAPLI